MSTVICALPPAMARICSWTPPSVSNTVRQFSRCRCISCQISGSLSVQIDNGIEKSATAEPIRPRKSTTTVAAASEAGMNRSSAEATGDAISPVTTARQTGARKAWP